MRTRLLLAVGSMLSFGVLAEAVVRLVGPELSLPSDERRFRFDQRNHLGIVYHERDDRLGWRLKRSQRIRMRVATTGAGGEFRTNSHGFRGRDFDLTPTPGVVRILVIGDSNAMGYGVPSDEAIYSRGIEILLSRHFGGQGLGFEVLNMGIDGFSSHQVRLLVEDYVPVMEPDFVCIQVGFNDHCLAVVPDAKHRFSRPFLLDVLERSDAYRWFRRTLLVATGAHRRDYTPVPRVPLEAFDANLRDMVSVCRESGAEVLLLTTPPRIGYPLVINEIPVTEDGETIWTTETAWINARLEAAGVDPPDQASDPRYLEVVEDLLAERADWATLHFMKARALHTLGDHAGAEAARRIALETDQERDQFERYMDRLREIASSTPEVYVVDVEAALKQAIGVDGPPPLGDESKDLFVDFVHLDEQGQVVVATAAAELIARRLTSTGRAAPVR